MAEAAQGIGDMLGPIIGSMLYSLIGYKMTFMVYAGVFTIIVVFIYNILPWSLNNFDYLDDEERPHAHNLREAYLV